MIRPEVLAALQRQYRTTVLQKGMPLAQRFGDIPPGYPTLADIQAQMQTAARSYA